MAAEVNEVSAEDLRKIGAFKQPEALTPIVRHDHDFENTGRDRIGGSSYSSGVFREMATARLWIGKGEYRASEDETEGMACQEKIAADVYAFYGARIPRMEVARQELTNTGLVEDQGRHAIHVMSELLEGFHEYRDQLNFNSTTPNPNGSIVRPDDQTIPERGLGHILAVACFIRDVDVIGSGANIGYLIKTDETTQQPYAQTVKIDPGAAFDRNPLIIVPPRHIRIALQAEPNTIAFDDLPPQTQQEFLLTLHDILTTNEVELARFFNRPGGEQFLLRDGRTVRQLTDMLLDRQQDLRTAFAQELDNSQADYQTAVLSHHTQLQAQREAQVLAAVRAEEARKRLEGLRLNITQQQILAIAVNVPVEAVLFDYPQHIDWLHRCIAPLEQEDVNVLLSRLDEDLIAQTLRAIHQRQRDHGGDINVENNTYVARDASQEVDEVSTQLYNGWFAIRHCVQNQDTATFAEVLPALTSIPNYDPRCLIAMQQFQQALGAANLPEPLIPQLVCLRELYLEMTPLTEHQYGEDYRPSLFRIGDVPVNLDQFGPKPTKGEVVPNIVTYRVNDKLNLHEQYQEQLATSIANVTEAAERERAELQLELERIQRSEASYREIQRILTEELQAFGQKHSRSEAEHQEYYQLMETALANSERLSAEQQQKIDVLQQRLNQIRHHETPPVEEVTSRKTLSNEKVAAKISTLLLREVNNIATATDGEGNTLIVKLDLTAMSNQQRRVVRALSTVFPNLRRVQNEIIIPFSDTTYENYRQLRRQLEQANAANPGDVGIFSGAETTTTATQVKQVSTHPNIQGENYGRS